jgi:hypothetical protein
MVYGAAWKVCVRCWLGAPVLHAPAAVHRAPHPPARVSSLRPHKQRHPHKQVLINVLILFPWSLVLLLSFVVNKWQLLFRPVGGLLWWCVDWLDQRLPSLVEWLLWCVYQVSLLLHVLAVGINLGVIWVRAAGGCCALVVAGWLAGWLHAVRLTRGCQPHGCTCC